MDVLQAKAQVAWLISRLLFSIITQWLCDLAEGKEMMLRVCRTQAHASNECFLRSNYHPEDTKSVPAAAGEENICKLPWSNKKIALLLLLSLFLVTYCPMLFYD